jgi:hypothetical protein
MGLAILDKIQWYTVKKWCHILYSGSNLALVRCCEGCEALPGKV